MLATLAGQPFSDPKWIFECKFDGVRCLAFRHGDDVRLMSRNQKNLNNAFPELRDAIAVQPLTQFIIDGEIVVFKPGTTLSSFSQIQQRLGVNDAARSRLLRKRFPAFYFVFDVLHVNGFDVTALPVIDRKTVLRSAIRFGKLIHYSEHLKSHGEKFLAQACRQGWEGLLAKRADSRYTAGRSRDWLKLKCVNEQEFVVGGYTDPKESRVGFGSLLVGYYDKRGNLRYAGGVGTGYTDDLLRELHARLVKIRRRTSPFAENISPRHLKGAHWVAPTLVAQVGFTEWTRDGRLRHPRFVALRSDKPARSVVREG